MARSYDASAAQALCDVAPVERWTFVSPDGLRTDDAWAIATHWAPTLQHCVWLDVDPSGHSVSEYQWITVHIGHDVSPEQRDQQALAARASVIAWRWLAACRGFSVRENPRFWQAVFRACKFIFASLKLTPTTVIDATTVYVDRNAPCSAVSGSVCGNSYQTSSYCQPLSPTKFKCTERPSNCAKQLPTTELKGADLDVKSEFAAGEDEGGTIAFLESMETGYSVK
ncbi:hypothetical protein ATCC90586_009751 [Pythium insidiosum]|nr:hypothetical protein ATCC90586_009751 [Pythium insidiosum]